MRIIKYSFPFFFCLAFSLPIRAQVYNWGSLSPDNRHIVHAYLGVDFGLGWGLGYGYQIKNKVFPLVIDADFSTPMGDNLFDDFKTKAGIHIRWVSYKNVHFSTRIHGIFRRYSSDLVTILNFGSDIQGAIGYYRKHWFVAAEVGFDKAVINHFKHTDAYREQFPDVKDGWYLPSAGGNFYVGMEAGGSFGMHDLHLKGGYIVTQNFSNTPTIPFYLQLGYNIRLGKPKPPGIQPETKTP